MKLDLKLTSVSHVLSVAVILGWLAFPAVAGPSSLAGERSQESTNSKVKVLVQDVLNEAPHAARRGFPRRRVGGGSHFVGVSVDKSPAL